MQDCKFGLLNDQLDHLKAQAFIDMPRLIFISSSRPLTFMPITLKALQPRIFETSGYGISTQNVSFGPVMISC